MKNLIAYFIFLISFSTEGLAAESVTLQTITVKGTKEEKNYFETYESISVLQENEIPATGRENNLQVLNAVPNVEVNKNGESFSIRGINNTGVTGYQKDNLSSILIDDIFQTDLAIQAGGFDLWDMQQVEILKGAQSTNQGVNSLAGAILLNHHKPTFSTEGAAKLGLGNFWHREAGVIANNVLVNDKIASRISYNKEMNDGYIKNKASGNDRWGAWNRDRFNLGLLYKISETSSLNFVGKFNQNRQGGTYTQGNDAFKYEVYEDQDYNVKTDNVQTGLTYKNNLNQRTKNTLIFGYSKSNQEASSDADGTAQDTAGTRIESHKDHYFSVENQLLYKHENVTNLLGIHAHDFRLKDEYDFKLLYPIGGGASTPLSVQQGVDRINRAFSLFDSVTYGFDHNQAVVGGLRAEYVESRYQTDVTAARVNDLGPGSNAAIDNYLALIRGSYDGKKSNAVVLPKLGYTVDDDLNHWGLVYTRGYRTSGVAINRRRATAVEYDPEFTNNYEFSYKYAGTNFQFSSNLFWIDWRDQQVQVQLSNDFYDTQVQNAGQSEVYGGEIEGKSILATGSTLTLGIGYSDTKFKTFQTSTINYADKKFPFASNWTGRLAHEIKATEQLSFLTVLRYLSDSYQNAENTLKSEGQLYLNLNMKYAIGEWMIESYVNNLFDGQFKIFNGAPTSATSPYQASYHQTSTPREFGARMTYFW